MLSEITKTRRHVLKTAAVGALAAPFLNFGSFRIFAQSDRSYSAQAIDLVERRRRGPDFFANFERALEGNRLAAPVLYPGSIQRTSFAEQAEDKGYMTLAVEPPENGGRLVSKRFHRLPARPMVALELHPGTLRGEDTRAWLERQAKALPPDAVLRLRVVSSPSGPSPRISSQALRSAVPDTMTLQVVWPRRADAGRAAAEGSR
ncbi:MAG: hypothetical protein VYE73_02990 [Acidobacteriota bacterium]|nr:hypothetical protein [Acidobacteriota bacterium]